MKFLEISNPFYRRHHHWRRKRALAGSGRLGAYQFDSAWAHAAQMADDRYKTSYQKSPPKIDKQF